MAPRPTFRFTALALLLVVSVTMAQDSPFQCGVLDDNDDNLKTISNTNFDTIETDYRMKSWGNKQLMPKHTHWHIYAIPDGELPRYSSIPEGFLKPKVSGSTLELVAQDDVLEEDLGYSKGDKMEAAVNLYIPVSQLRNIRVDGVDSFVEIIVTEDLLGDDIINNSTTSDDLPTINIRASGVDSRLYVNTPYSKVKYTGSGVDNTAVVEAGTGSSVVLSGVDQSLKIKSDYLSSVRLSGVDQYMLIEGTYEKVTMSGVDGNLRVNGETGCNAIDMTGVKSNCKTSSQETVTVPILTCTADTKAVQACSKNGWCLSTGATIGVVLALFVVVVLCVWLCVRCCGCGRRGRHSNPPAPTTTADQEVKQSSSPKASTQQVPNGNWVEAEVIEVEPAHDEVFDDPEQPQPSSDNDKKKIAADSSVNAKPY
jgi:hypothetical protein